LLQRRVPQGARLFLVPRLDSSLVL
jgi:hypothetical protein